MEKGNIGANIKKYRTKLNITQQQLADKLSVSRPTIASYESGRTEPDIATMEKLAEIFGISVDELLGKIQNEKQKHSDYKVALAVGLALNAIMFIRNMLFYIRDKFFYVKPGIVTEEMEKPLAIRFALYDVINFIDRYFPAIFVIGVFLIILFLVKSDKKHKFINFIVIVSIIIITFIINIEFSIFINPYSKLWRGNYYDIMLQMFIENRKLAITLISFAIAGGSYTLIKRIVENKNTEK